MLMFTVNVLNIHANANRNADAHCEWTLNMCLDTPPYIVVMRQSLLNTSVLALAQL